MVDGGVICVNIIPFNCLRVCTFLMVLQYLRSVVDSTNGMSLFNEVLGKFGGVAIISECVLVFVTTY